MPRKPGHFSMKNPGQVSAKINKLPHTRRREIPPDGPSSPPVHESEETHRFTTSGHCHAFPSPDYPTQNLVALAAACGVTVEWLATGHGPMRPGQAPPPEPAPLPAPPVSTKLFATVDMDLLGECMAIAYEQLQRRSPYPSWGRAAQIATLLYDQIKEDRDTVSKDAESH